MIGSVQSGLLAIYAAWRCSSPAGLREVVEARHQLGADGPPQEEQLEPARRDATQ